MNQWISIAFSVVILAAALASADPSMDDYNRLHKDLFENYNAELAPVTKSGNATQVAFNFAPLCIELEDDGIFKGKVWYRYSWDDERLAFDSEKYNGISVIRVNPKNIWIPDIVLYNRHDAWNNMFSDRSLSSNVLIYPTGNVLWVPEDFMQANCLGDNVDLNDPFADQTCTLKFGSWTFDGFVLDPVFYGDNTVDVKEMEPNCRSEIVNSSARKIVKYYDCCSEPYPNLTFNITIRNKWIKTGDHAKIWNPKIKCEV